MRRSLLVILMLLLACSFTSAADYIRLDKDQINENATEDFSFYILRECPEPDPLVGTSNGWVVTAVGNATWTFNSFTADTEIVTGYPPTEYWWAGLAFLNAFNNVTPDSFLVGAAAVDPWVGAPPMTEGEHLFFDLNLTMGELPEGSTGDEICFDSAFILPAGSWKFSGITCGQGGAPDRPKFLCGSAGDDLEICCIPVIAVECEPPDINGTPIGDLVEEDICGTATFGFSADPGSMGGNPAVIVGWTVTAGIGIIDNSGNYSASVDPDECGVYDVTIEVENDCGGVDDYDFQVEFVNADPYFIDPPPDCIAMTPVGQGDDLTFTLNVGDPDACQNLTLVLDDVVATGGTYAGDVTILGNDLTVATEEADGGIQLCIFVSVRDECAPPIRGGTAQIQVGVDILTVEPLEVQIDKKHDVYQGHYTWVGIWLNKGSLAFGGFDFLVGYDQSALIFMGATLGEDLINDADLLNKWEYFTYRFNWNGNCGGSCPSGLLRVVGIADLNNGPNHPPDASLKFQAPRTKLVDLQFYVTNDRTFQCMYAPIRFLWDDCGDNTMSSKMGDSLFLSRNVYNYELNDWTGTIMYGGHWWLDGPPYPVTVPNDVCMNDDPLKPDAIPLIDFIHGGVDIICSDSIDARGDLNLNAIANEIADAVLYTNYFIYGLGVFNVNSEGQIAASDVNNDGRVLTVGDLVYLVRIITGDELAIPKLSPYANTVDVSYGNTVSSNSAVDLGAALFVFDGAADVELLADGMEFKSDVVDGQTRVLVWSDGTNRIPSGNSDIFTVNGDVTLVEVSISDYYGNLMNVNTAEKVLPTSYALLQNYPNPFNPSTDITIVLPEPSEYRLDIYNVAGQLVETFGGYGVNEITVTWNATGVASGIYFYKATAGQFTATKKMVLMK